MSRIEGKVASILNEREVVLTVGDEHGVQIGMQFNILYPGGLEIPDPDRPGIIIDSIEWPKTQVKVVQVYPQLAVARTFRTLTTPSKGFNMLAAVSGFDYEPSKTVVETLRTDGSFAEREIDAAESVVKVGDPAVQVSTHPRSKDEGEH
ncbi:hypothetical protein [Microcella sp.]|uniref:hypothetical protein n=1 Tax=Microcella sp. TaxID=1913979 RepID=UPI00391CF5DF